MKTMNETSIVSLRIDTILQNIILQYRYVSIFSYTPSIHDISYINQDIRAPEMGAKGSKDILMSFKADSFDNQHAVTEQSLDPLLLKLLQQVGTVAGQGVHDHSAVELQLLHPKTTGHTCKTTNLLV